MRRLSANKIWIKPKTVLDKGIIELDDKGEILNIIDTNGKLKESANLEFYNGVLIPGFVNTHCHLELSYMQNTISDINDLPDFLIKVSDLKRKTSYNENLVKKAINEQINNGIVAIGDICNTVDTIAIKKHYKDIYYHNFIEVISIVDRYTNHRFNDAKLKLEQFKSQIPDSPVSITAHAPYTVTEKMFRKLAQFAKKNKSILSIHNQETLSENEMYQDKSGKIIEIFEKSGFDFSDIKKSGKTSLQTYYPIIQNKTNILLVHNIYTKQADIDILKNNTNSIYFVLCPKSNLLIEKKLPDIRLFLKNQINLTIGTDSLASNNNLSILDEIKVLQHHHTGLSFDELISWSTYNGAKALNIDSWAGTLEIGKKPGINLIRNFNFETNKIKATSSIKKII